MNFLNALQALFTFSFAGGLANMFLTSNPLAAMAIGAAGVCAVGYLYGLFPRVVGSVYVLCWVGSAHLFILFMRDLMQGTHTPLLNEGTVTIYLIALACGVAANFAQIRELVAMRQAGPNDDGGAPTA